VATGEVGTVTGTARGAGGEGTTGTGTTVVGVVVLEPVVEGVVEAVLGIAVLFPEPVDLNELDPVAADATHDPEPLVVDAHLGDG
jgi:hypothetical protein